ncbi:NAD(P)-dependent oxidoreductase [Kineosporia babensis]|uniref:NAD(P)-binding domain-containing protein n=1 Tax=Kineosporia babensis TaxID=499548 RepID=A0A9X1NFF0_9ACTN|nr:NAD(P)-binding domain-containing protein [Kineosporia babensis]MCD5312855.1 NAD(P)-binding domain-containing protein [Kineosporia babensis]
MTTFLGTGAMGSALAGATLSNRRNVRVWNRNPDRTAPLADRGAQVLPKIEPPTDGPLVACLFDHLSVHESLDPIADDLRGHVLINLTTTTPGQARELAAWAARHGIAYLDGAIMAVPEMIGGPGAVVLYSGRAEVFEQHRDLLQLWGEARYFGADAGLASLYDLAMLSGMYQMFAGFLHGAAMVADAQVPAVEFAQLQAPFLATMTQGLADYAQTVDARDYTAPGQQSLRFTETALAALEQASGEAGVGTQTLHPVRRLVRNQIESGHGEHGTARIYEEFRSRR